MDGPHEFECTCFFLMPLLENTNESQRTQLDHLGQVSHDFLLMVHKGSVTPQVNL